MDGVNDGGDAKLGGLVEVKEASSACRLEVEWAVDRAVDIVVDNFVDYSAGQPQLGPRNRACGDQAKAAAF